MKSHTARIEIGIQISCQSAVFSMTIFYWIENKSNDYMYVHVGIVTL